MPPMATDFTSSFDSALSLTAAQVSLYFPKIIAALLILIIGTLIAKWGKSLVMKALEYLQLSKILKNTPIEGFLANAEVSTRIEQVVGVTVYWLIMLVVLQTAVSLLGLTSLSLILDRVLAYIPKIFSAIIILFFGMIVAGVLESVIKGAVRSIEGFGAKQARALGKVTSYLTIVIFILAAVSELGIAEQFIIILFVGVVATLTLALGLSVGLGSKDIVGKIVSTWYTGLQKEMKK